MFSRALVSGLVIVTSTLGLVGCDQIPSLSPEDQAANKTACETISVAWDGLNAAMSSGDLMQLPAAIAALPAQADAALSLTTDKQLTEALTDLKTKATNLMATGDIDVTGLVGAGVGISARCALLGAPVELPLPETNQ